MATTYFMTPGPNQDQTGYSITWDFQAKPWAASIAITVSKHDTTVLLEALDGNTTITANVVTPNIGDKLEIIIPSDVTSPATTYTVTFGTGFKMPANTLSMTGAKQAKAAFIFTGTAWLGASTLSAS